jgi:hypothetical protein
MQAIPAFNPQYQSIGFNPPPGKVWELCAVLPYKWHDTIGEFGLAGQDFGIDLLTST